MTKFKLPKYHIRKNGLSFKNYAVFVATAMLVLITAHAKSAHLGGGVGHNLSQAEAAATATAFLTEAPQGDLQNIKEEKFTSTKENTEAQHPHHHSLLQNNDKQFEETKEQQQQEQQSAHRKHHKHQQHLQIHHQNVSLNNKHHQHYTQYHPHGNLLTQYSIYEQGKRPYRSKYSIEDLMNTKFERKLSNDIDMDPCKASGFMGDIALPDINYGDSNNNNNNDDDNYPVVAHTIEWQPQADAPVTSGIDSKIKLNATFQQELEILKQEVYHEGLQVEEEGLTDIIRKKTKLPSTSLSSTSNNYNNNAREHFDERSRNEAVVLSANELVKPIGYSTSPLKNLKSEILNPQQPHLKQQTNLIYSSSEATTNFEPHISIYEKSIKVDGNEDVQQAILSSKIVRNLEQKLSKNEEDETQKPNKSVAMTAWNIRNVDQRKIQSNTKDIEDDSGNNFVSERKLVIMPTSLPTQRSTAANTFSNDGGNGMRLDDVDLLHAEGVMQSRRRHRRRRKNRRSSDHHHAEYINKLQKLREELNRPVRTKQDFQQHSRSTNNNNHHHYQHQQQQQQHHHQQQRQQHHHHHHQQQQQQQVPIESTQFNRFHHGNNKKSEAAMSHGHLPMQQQQHQHPLHSSYNFTEKEKTFNYSSWFEHAELPPLDQMDYQNTEHSENQHAAAHHRRMARAVTAKKERVWDYGVIPYEIDGNFSGLHKALFKQAMRHWENSTCIKFVERDPEIHPNYIVFTIRSCGCCSFVGKRGNGAQAISIGRNCDKFGIVVHELGHVVGFWHEHTRPDREKHVVIELDNIMKGQDYNFNKLTPDEVDSLGQAYDYDSIMHYARNTFSKGTYLDTILPIEMKGRKRPEIGQRLRLSSGDISQANLLYKCPRCGRTFQENTGQFASPSYYTGGALTNETEHCEWRITATHGERVVLRLENLNIFKSENCQTDYLEIRDGYYFKSPLIGRFCGKIASEEFTTVSSRMLLTYVNTHRSELYRGFKAEYEVICGGELSVDDSEGRLESPNYPLDYLPNKECVWKITVPKGYQVALKFQSFEVENHDSCVYDFVEVRDGPTQDSALIGVFCGNKPPPNMKSSGNAMFVKFVSDTSVQKAGFSAIFMKEVDECETQNHGCEHECINTLGGYECSCHIGYELHSDKKHCEDACGGVIEYPNGTITSPSFPDMYPILKECIWEIIAQPKHKISLNFTHFDLEGTSHQQSDCGYDSVTIYSKLAENRLKRIGTYCGSMIPPTATSESNALRIEFHSDKSIQRSGFAAVFFTDIDECSVNNGGCQHECRNTIGSYVCSCHNGYSLHENGHDCKEGECKYVISLPFGNIFSPNFPDPYPPNADCVWHFMTTPGHRIKLIFIEFNVESHQECSYDNVAIYDGESESSAILGRFCGDKMPYPISSSTNQLYMVLKTDKNKQLNGFRAMHSTSCGGYLRATNQIQQFYSHALFGNSNYDENMDCEWTIQAPASSNVHLVFLTFDIESSENCSYDYVQVYSGMEDTSGPMFGQFCGNTVPQDTISMTDSLLVRFKTDSSVTMKGFSISYVAVDPYENSDEDNISYSSEMVTPFPGSLKSIYKDDTQESDYDFNENRLMVGRQYSSRSELLNEY